MNTPTKPNDGGPAFPYCKEMEKIQGLQFSTGMTLRAYFAAEALPLAKAMEDKVPGFGSEATYKGIAYRAVLIADALIAELNK